MFFRHLLVVSIAAVILIDNAEGDEYVHACSSTPCLNEGRCCEGENIYTCNCKPGYTGVNCETETFHRCSSIPCLNGGLCCEEDGRYTCTCKPGFTGVNCETELPILILRNDLAGFNAGFFNRSWAQFKQEFGNPTSQYWYGLDRLQELTQRKCVARYDIQLTNGSWRYAEYSTFSVGDPSTNYTSQISGYSGNAGDSLSYQNGQQFQTYDFNRGSTGPPCAIDVGGGYWHDQTCSYLYLTASANGSSSWFIWLDQQDSEWLSMSVVESHLSCV